MAVKKTTLLKYFEKHDISVYKAANKLGISSMHLRRILAGTHRPSIKLAQKIQAYTDGVITWEELVNPASSEKSVQYEFKEMK